MSDCESFEVEISAMVDGELEPDSVLPVIDHLAGCDSCRRFYERIRGLESRLAHLPVSQPLAPAPDRIWKEIEQQSGLRPRRGWWNRPIPVWTWGAATAVAAAVFVLTLSPWEPEPDGLPLDLAQGTPMAIEIDLEANRDRMDDRRFVELTSELLQADRRYHRKMYEVLGDVQRLSFIPEGSNEVRTVRNIPRGEHSGSEPREQENDTGLAW